MATKIVICDTDVMIDYWNINNHRHLSTKHILENSIGIENGMLSAITVMELINGAANKYELNKINKDIRQYKIALIDNAISEMAIKLFQLYRLSHGLALPDAFIAATCKILDVELYSHNIKDYKFIDGLVLFS